MFFLRKHKQQKDQGAGLVFRWRGARRHHSGKILAFFLALGFFGLSAYAIRVEGLRAPLLTKRTGKVVMLNDDDPHCQALLLQVEDRSPFPFRWDPAFDAATMGRITAETALLDGPVWDYLPAMAQVPEGKGVMPLPSISQEGSRFFNGNGDRWNEFSGGSAVSLARPSGDLRVSVQILADQDLRASLPTAEILFPSGVIPDDWFGHSFRFLVGVDAFGVVRGCLPLSGSSMEVAKATEKQKMLAVLLRRMTFKASDDEEGAVRIGVLELQIEALQE